VQVPVQAPADTLTYEPFFGLTEKPFSLEADPKFIYDSPVYLAARKNLLAGIRRREGLLVLTGEIGMGKTTLCRTVLRDLGRNTYSSLVPDPFAAREDLLKMLLIDFGVLSIDEVASGRLQEATRTELGYRLAQFLNGLPADAYAVAIIDEAQNLTVPLIEETRILFDTFGAKGRLQIVFSGQPELHAKLKLPEMRQVDQRVCGYQRLAPMTAEAVGGYIQHRLHAAGARGDRVLFSPAVVDTLHRRTGGVPRLINRLCDRALQLAFERKADRVDAPILDAALSDIGATTLSPTWDAIVFAQPPAAAPPAAPAVTPVPLAQVFAPEAASEPAPIPPAGDEFHKDIVEWFSQEIGPPTNAPSSSVLDELNNLSLPRRRVPAPKASRRPIETDWPRHVTSETYIQKLMRTWVKRSAIAVGAFVAVNLVVASGSFLLETQAKPVVAEVAPLATVPLEAASVEPPAPIPAKETPAPMENVARPVTASAQGDYFIAVGLFAARSRADELVESLTHAGLPAMQRPYQYRDREVQQIVLGPFFSDAEARADLQRLKALGGYDDARVISSQ
jgi:type II secretory pathway predicted ATPase ExeA/cell division septation protein DedD